MENASKAIIIAGAILIAVGLMSLFIYFFNSLREYNASREEQRTNQDINSWNRFFEESLFDVDGNPSNGYQVNGYDVYNIAMKAFDNNQRLDGYYITVYIKNVKVVDDEMSLEQVKNNLAGTGVLLSYDKLQYGNYDSTDKVDKAAADRQQTIDVFNSTYTIQPYQYSSEGRINRIIIE